MNISRLILIMTPLFLAACGGGGGGGGDAAPAASEAANNNQQVTETTSPVDGASVELDSDSDGFIYESDISKSSASLAAPTDHSFKPSALKTLSIVSAGATPCHLNVYSRYSVDGNGVFVPEGNSKVIQAYSADCSYSGRLYAMNHWNTVLLEVIDSSLAGAAEYYELSVDAGSISMTIN
jgi:hypothetical protein